ncbi:MerR family transcriptional regulator [Insulibacter thermoxylanivorax]|uniref:MerR family transcriptional regulator n=1 Tax=Insulibacter thermoxylanivorax TaxID=2749268 RepID=A0A916VFH9_9BACL|nr:MerR family transcriptional regulator [Insulibacter thermoxylanivorax]GFR37898.1 MerR family transcriptional regulator [Insulibacter thermoxylanivorax]
MNKAMSIGEFAKMTGVSQRTLRFYEEKGLLKPSFVSESGRRSYKMDDLVVLQEILAYKYLGFSLEEIRAMMLHKPRSLKQNLLLQKQAMLQKRASLDQVIKALDHALELLETEETLDPQVLSFIIQSIITEPKQLSYLSEIFPEHTLNHIKQLFSDQARELEWNKRAGLLFHQMKQAVKQHPPESEAVQLLVDELFTMTREIIGGDWDTLQEASGKLEELVNTPDLFGSPFTAEEEQLVMQACDYYMRKKGLIPDEA